VGSDNRTINATAQPPQQRKQQCGNGEYAYTMLTTEKFAQQMIPETLTWSSTADETAPPFACTPVVTFPAGVQTARHTNKFTTNINTYAK
jgi:hypothetical protein